MAAFLAPDTIAGRAYLAPDVPPQAADTTAPTQPGPLSVSNITQTGARITWPAATDDVGVAGYEVSVDTGTPAWIDVGSPNPRIYDVSGKSAGTNYTARERAYDAAGNRSAPITQTFTTEAPITPAPPLNGKGVITRRGGRPRRVVIQKAGS